MRKRPTARAAVVVVAGLLLILAGSTAQAGWLFVLAAAVLGLVGASLLQRHSLKNLRVTRTVPAVAVAGDPIIIKLAFHNEGGRATTPTLAEDFLIVPPAGVLCERLKTSSTANTQLQITAHRRGVYWGDDVALMTAWPFGFFRSRRIVRVESRLTIVPRSVALRSFPVMEPSSFPAEALHERARVGGGLDYRGVREYRPGDSPRAVHWRSSARSGRLVVREYEQHMPTPVAVVVCGGDDGIAPDSSFEALVAAAASVGRYAVTTGHPVEILRSGTEGSIERIAQGDTSALLKWLAGAAARDVSPAPLVRAAVDRVGMRGTVVVCCPTAGLAGSELPAAIRVVQASGNRAIAVVARSSSWGGHPPAFSVEEEVLLRELGGRAGIRTLSKGEELARCLEG